MTTDHYLVYYVITNQLKQPNEIMDNLVSDRKLGDHFIKTKFSSVTLFQLRQFTYRDDGSERAGGGGQLSPRPIFQKLKKKQSENQKNILKVFSFHFTHNKPSP